MEKSIWALEKEEIVEHMCEIQEQDPEGLARGDVRSSLHCRMMICLE